MSGFHTQNLLQQFQFQIKELISGLKEDESKLELAKILAQREELKAECRLNEKRMTQLVKTSNKLQEAFDNVCLENQAMRYVFNANVVL